MLKSIHTRLIASYLLVILLAMGIATLLAWSALDRAFLDVLRENLLAQARRVAQTVEADGISAGAQPIPYSQVANVLPGYHTRVIDDQGVVILGLSTTDVYTTSAEFQSFSLSDYDELASNLGISRLDIRSRSDAPADDLLGRSEIQSALRGEPATAVRSYNWTAQRRILYAAYPIHSPDGNVFSVVYIASPLPRLTLSLLPDYFGAQALGGVSMAVALAGLVGLMLARQLTRPLRQLTDAASALARGEPATPIPPASTSELRSLGTAFNTMNASLTVAHDALVAQAHQR
jgi:HAMP domain-containing protein